MKPKPKLFVLISLFCLVLTTCLLSVFSAQKFNMNVSGEIEFVASGLDVEVSSATFTGVGKKEGSGQMQGFAITPSMTESQIAELSGVQSWKNIKLLFEEQSQGRASISFTITNKSSKSTENVMVELSTNTTQSSTIQATPSADFCLVPGASHTFTIQLIVADTSNSVSLSGVKLSVGMKTLKPSEVVSQAEYQDEGLAFETDPVSKTASIKSQVDNLQGALEIPAVIKDSNDNVYTVTTIAEEAFIYEQIESLVLPNTLTTIEKSAFEYCDRLAGDLIIPDGVVTIGDGAFMGCLSLEGTVVLGNNVQTIGRAAFSGTSELTGELILPKSLKTIGPYAFSDCGLTGDIIIPEGVTSIGEGAFDSSGITGATLPTTLTEIPKKLFRNCSFSGNFIIPNGVTTIREEAFSYCSRITSLTLPSSLTSIGAYAFSYCSSLTGDLTIPSGEIGANAFYKCTGLNGNLVFGGGVTSIGEKAFNGLTAMVGTLTFSEGLTTIGESAFSGCSGLTGGLAFPDSLISIGNNAFLNCKKLNGNISFGDNLTTIGGSAFSGCEKLTGGIIIPDSVTNIGSLAFKNCSSLNGNLTIGDGVTTIASQTFYYCSKLTGNLTIGNNVTAIEASAFYECGFTGNLIIPNGVTKIGDSAFWGCSGLTDVSISSTVNSIGEKAFSLCSKLQTLTVDSANTVYYSKDNCLISKNDKILIAGTNNSIIPQNDGITRIESWAFGYCIGLSGDLVIPNSVTSIGESAFLHCVGLKGSLTLSNNLTKIENSTFKDCGLTGNLVIPNSISEIGDFAFDSCRGMTGSLVIPDSVTTIGKFAFSQCDFTGDVTIPNSVTTIGEKAFWYCDNFYGILTIGSGVKTIGPSAFQNCSRLDYIKVLATTPPTLQGTSCFDSTNSRAICVPADSVDTYKTATNWTEYASRINALAEGDEIGVDGIVTTRTDAKYTSVYYTVDTLAGRAYVRGMVSNASTTEIIVLPEIVYKSRKFVVDEISDCAFQGNTNLIKITIPQTITQIGPKAFAGCTNLTNMVFENTTNWYATTSMTGNYGVAVNVSNISIFTTTYRDFYIKQGTYSEVLNMTISLRLGDVEYVYYYIQYHQGMTWQDLIDNQDLNQITNSKDEMLGALCTEGNYVGYIDAEITFSESKPAPPVLGEYVAPSDIIEVGATYAISREFPESSHFIVKI